MKKKNYFRAWLVQNSDTGKPYRVCATRQEARDIRQFLFAISETYAPLNAFEVVRVKIVKD